MKEGFGATIVRILTKGGKQYSKQVNYRRGNKNNPMTREEIIEKFLYTVDSAEGILPDRNPEQIIHLIDELERVRNMGELIQLIIV